jgi:uncharacterized protein involved in type VI secretion and phage assembly
MSTSMERILADLVTRVEGRYYGKYRGLVVDNADPGQLGRLRLRVPSVLGEDIVTGWALPCAPYGGADGHGILFVPEVGAGVWVEFEEGDLEFPIWVGTYWSQGERGSEAPRPNRPDGSEEASIQDPPSRKIIKTAKGHTLQFEDADGSEMIVIVEAVNGHVITLDASGIKVTVGKLKHEITLDAAGITIVDGVNSGNTVTMDGAGVTIADRHGNSVVLSAGGIQIGSKQAREALVLGTSLARSVQAFMAALNTHVHTGNMGAPTTPPVVPLQLQVPLSPKNTVE